MNAAANRRLAAILSADAVGYTRLMRENETGTIEDLQTCRSIFSALANRHQGKIVDTAGDSALVEFQSVLQAVEFALAAQKDIEAVAAERSTDRCMRFRMGITVGDIVADGDRIYGDGINIAARLQTLAEPGGICISGAAYEQVKDKLDLKAESLGRRRLKNVAEPVACYQIEINAGAKTSPRSRSPRRAVLSALLAGLGLAVGAVLLQLERGERAPAEPPSAPAAVQPTEQPSVAVLPFDNLSDDLEQTYFSDGVTTDVITDLSRLQNLRVIARQTAFVYKGQSVSAQDIGRDLGVRYVVEGSVQKAADRLRINVQVTDTETGFHLWGERYDRPVDDLFAVQDEVTRRIVEALAVQLTSEELQNLGQTASRSFEAYDLFLQGQERFRSRTREGNQRSRELYQQAIELDPQFARAYGAYAVALSAAYWRGWTDSPYEARTRALELASKAVVLDDRSPQAHWSLGYAHVYRKEYEEATKAAERAVELAPNYADGYGLLAFIDNHTGRFERAANLIEKAMKLNPYYTFEYPYNLGRAYHGMGEYEKAAAWLEKSLSKNQHAGQPRLFLASSYLRLGRLGDAEWEVEQSLMLDPGLTRSQIAKTLPVQERAQVDALLADLRKAGLPE